LDPEVLIVDEVLAVGDAEFQRKCFGQIGKVANCGATILLVSHQLPMITALCSRALLLEQGGIRTDGTVSEVLDCYLNSSRALQGIPLNQRTDRTGSGRIRVQELRLRDSASGALLEELSSGKAIDIELDYTSSGFGTLKTLVFTLVFKGANGEPLFTCSSDLMPNAPASWPAKGTARCSISAFPALPGQYSILLWVGIGKEQADRIDNATTFSVQAGDFFGSGKLPNSHKHGPLLVKHTWGIR
jgi:lipopolysaccharide transport system ATP-binding protein